MLFAKGTVGGNRGGVGMDLRVDLSDCTDKPYRACPWHPIVVVKNEGTLLCGLGEKI